MSTLPILRIRTNHSEYLIDQNTQKFSRRAVHARANRIDGFSDAEWHDYTKIYTGLNAGEALVITTPTGSALRSTLVQSVEEIKESA